MRVIDGDALIRNTILNPSHVPYITRTDVDDAPTIELERKTGKWVKVDEKPYFRKHFDRVCCSACRAEGISKWSFCPNCGADMRGEQNE